MSQATTATESPIGVSWDEVRDWDERFYLHPFRARGEYSHLPVEHAEGSYVYLADGRRVLDFVAQYICANMGQGHPKIRDAIVEAAHRFTYLSEPWTSDYRSKAAKLIVEDLLGPDGWAGAIRFLATGSEAVEMALIMAKLFTGRPNVVTQEFSYHGWTQGASGATGLRSSRGHLSTADGEVREIPGFPPPEYHLVPAPSDFPRPTKVGKSGRLEVIEETERVIEEIGADTIAAFVCDIAQGPGIHPPPEYIPEMRELTRRHGILWIDDEILCGFGRCGTWFGYQLYPGVTPDIMVLGKGIVGAAAPAAAIVVRKDIGEFFATRRWWLPSTMAAHPIAMAAIVANIEAMREERVVEHAAKVGAYLGARLKELEQRHRSVGRVDGVGLFWAIELVKNKETGEPFVPNRADMAATDITQWPAQMVARGCFERGVFLIGLMPNTLRIGPPLTVSEAECDEAVAALDAALSDLDQLCY